MSIFDRIVDNRQEGSLATRMRQKRFAVLQSLMRLLPRPVNILDVGGVPMFWERMGLTDEQEVKVVLLNTSAHEVQRPNFTSVVGDAREMKYFNDREFDVVFSNSVIEHVGPYEDQMRMAAEVQRVGKRYFVQTPNRYFPIEPHFLFPFSQFFPIPVRVFLARNFSLGWFRKIPDKNDAKREALEGAITIRLLTESELKRLFPGAKLYREKILGLTKSFVVYKGWDEY